MKYSEILNNPHFNNIAAIIRVPFLSKSWREKHSNVPFWKTINELFDTRSSNRDEFISRFCEFLISLTCADRHLSYTEEDLNWFIDVMDSDYAQTIISLLFAWCSAPDQWLTPAEAANLTDSAASTWRNKAASGEIAGAFKKGKQWLLPKSVLRSRGLL